MNFSCTITFARNTPFAKNIDFPVYVEECLCLERTKKPDSFTIMYVKSKISHFDKLPNFGKTDGLQHRS